jgi:hypothetical protein
MDARSTASALSFSYMSPYAGHAFREFSEILFIIFLFTYIQYNNTVWILRIYDMK